MLFSNYKKTTTSTLEFLTDAQLSLRTRFRKRFPGVRKHRPLCFLRHYKEQGLQDTELPDVDDVSCIISHLKKQGLSEDLYELFKTMINSVIDQTSDQNNRHVMKEMLYTLTWVINRLQRVHDYSDIISILDYITRVHFGQQLGECVVRMCMHSVEVPAQSFDWTMLKHMVTRYDALKNHPVIVKFIKMVALAFTSGILTTLGFSDVPFMKLWDFVTESVKSLSLHTDFFAAMFDLIALIGDRITSFSLTGSWDSFLHTPTSYSKWADSCLELLDSSGGLCNPAAVGLDFHQFLKTLNELVVQGEEMKKYVRSVDDRDIISGLLSRIRVLKVDILVKCGDGERMSPFSMLISAGSSVGKTCFTDICFAHYAKLFNKVLEGGVYVRTAAETHWNKFKSSHWGCLMDDVASVNPNTSTTDPSLADVLQAVNNVHFSTPQAAIEDKGRTPFLCEIVISTTNTEHLYAHAWFNNPAAVRRRFPYVVNVVPKKEYRKPGTEMLDATRIPDTQPGHYPDLWDITVSMVSVVGKFDRQEIKLTEILVTDNIYTFIQHYNGWLREHRRVQTSYMNTRATIADVTLCDYCALPISVCDCAPAVASQCEIKDNLVLQGVPELDVQGAGMSLAMNAAVVATTFQATSFAADCVEQAAAEDDGLLSSPGKLLSSAARIGYKKCLTGKHALETMGIEAIKKYLRDLLMRKFAQHSKSAVTLLSVLGVVGGLALAWKRMRENFPDIVQLKPQSNPTNGVDVDAIGVTPAKGTDSENVWRKDNYIPSEFLGRLSCSWGNLDLAKVASIVGRNVVWCRTSHGDGKHTVFRALCVVGHLYVVPHHVLPFDDYFMLQVIHENNAEGCNGNIIFKVSQSLIYRLPDKELAFFEINHMPGRRDLRSVFPSHGVKMDGKGRMVTRMPNGTLEYNATKRSKIVYAQYACQVNQILDITLSTVERDTDNGQCGSPLIIKHPSSCVIAGLHCFGGQDKTAVSVLVFQSDIEGALRHYSTPPVDCNVPNLEAQAFTTNLSPRCTARFIPEGDLLVYGSFDMFKRQPKSTACDTIFTNYLLDRGHVRKYGPAPMKGYSAVHIALKSMVQKPMIFEEDILRECARQYTHEVLAGLGEVENLELRHPLSMMVALNGMPGVKFIDSMNFKTSAGFPRNRSKAHYIMRLPADEVWQHPVAVSQEIKDEVAEIWANMLSGVSSAPVFMQHLKDEALPLSKVKVGKARVHMGGPFAWSICVRMLFLPFIRVMQKNKYLFESAPGMNTTSVEWTRLYEYLTKFGGDRMIAGDFKNFDKGMGSLVILLAFSIIIDISAEAGMEPQYLTAMQTVAEDVAFSFVNYNGDLMRFLGCNPSGHPLTVIINCLVNCLYMRYCYHKVNPEHTVKDFRDNVRLITYGDDNVMGSRVDWFNHTSISRVLSTVGIQYTMADKVSESIEFIDISKVSFLKRYFRWEPELNAYAAPLEEDSIWKSLMIWIPSKDESPEKQAIDIVRSAVSEWFFYGKERFNIETKKLKHMVSAVDLSEYSESGTFCSWDTLVDRFNASSLTYLREEPQSTIDILGQCRWEVCDTPVKNLSLQGLEMRSPIEAKTYHNALVTVPQLDYLRGMLCGSVECVVCSPGRSPKALFRDDFGRQSKLVNYTCPHKCRDERINALANQLLKSYPDLPNLETVVWSHLKLQSAELQDGSANVTAQGNLMFSDAGMTEVLSTPMVSFTPDGDNGAGLGEFLSRPVAISSYSWVEGNTSILKLQFKPWALYFSTASIKRKLDNFARIRAKLHLKFVVNASPFYYGALRVCYNPIDSGFRDTYETTGDQIKFSQMPGGFLFPADMSSFEMELPFLTPNAWLDCTKQSDFTDMGGISYVQYAKLRSANGTAGQNVTVTCYAWATDVEVAGLTSGLSMQADEYDTNGVISGPATAVADVAAKFTNAPVVGPLARATEIGARAVGGIASLFGYSNPPVIDDVHAYVPKSFHAFSNVETSVPMDKLTLDPKNEITLDKRVTGAKADDELVITHFAGRKSFITGCLWTEAYAPGTQLMRFPVTPRNYSSNAVATGNAINSTPSSHVCDMFDYWRGGMVYTMKFVKSRYHTGRVQISWDPEFIPLTNPETTTMTRIVDLQLETEVTFTIPYKAQTAWLKTTNIANNWAISTGGTITASTTEHNGFIRVTVLNELTGPAASQEIDILLFAHTADDFQVSVPTELPLWSFLPVQSETTGGELAPVGSDILTPGINAITVGETVASLRTLLHRTSIFHRSILGNPRETSLVFVRKHLCTLVTYLPRFPVEYGFGPLALNYCFSGTKKQFQYSPSHPMNWVSNCFAGYRGSIVHQYNTVRNGQDLIDELKVERDPRTHILDVVPRQAINRFTSTVDSSSPSTYAAQCLETKFNVLREMSGVRGMSMTNTNTQSGLSVVTPQYSKWKFRPAYCKTRDTFSGETEIESIRLTAVARCGMSGDTVDDGWPAVNVYVAGGVDFDLIYFICVPTKYQFTMPPADNTF